jgi:hypothetical protein
MFKNKGGTKSMTQPWERQPNEYHKSWLWFKIYRDLLHERSFRKVIQYIEEYNKNITKTHPNPTNINEKPYPQPNIDNLKNLSRIHKWRDRVTAYDNYLDQQQRQHREQEFIDEENEYLKAIQAVRNEIQNQVMQINNNEKITPTSKLHALKSASQALDTNYKDLRLAHGRSTENRSTDLNAEVQQDIKQEQKINIDIEATLQDKKFHKDELKYLEELTKNK